MLTPIFRAAAVIGAALIATITMVAPAQADTRTFKDKGAHLTTVKVTNGSSNVTVKADVGPFTFSSFFTFWLDTNADNAGPEYKMVVHPNSDGPEVLRVGNFKDAGIVVPCPGFRATADASGPEVVTITVPRSCIGNPSKVRVSIRAYYDIKGPNVIDWGPGLKKFFGWVHR